MVKEIERAGIPVVHMCTVTPISMTVGANRIVPTIAIPHPLGNPALSLEEEKAIRRKLVERALEALTTEAFGELPIQIGYCNGHNELLNAVEYHRSSELNIAATDAILILGMQQDIQEDFTYDTSKMEAFLVPAGVGVEIYATTLHYAPCGVNGAGFQVAVVQPKGTNYPLEKSHADLSVAAANEDALLTAKNKWLIGHAEGGLDAGSYIGLKGKNLNVNE